MKNLITPILVLIFIVLSLAAIITSGGDVNEPKIINHTEQVIQKDIGHVKRFMDPSIQYYIITNNHTFEVDVSTYNGFHTGDNATIRTGYGCKLLYGDKAFYEV